MFIPIGLELRFSYYMVIGTRTLFGGRRLSCREVFGRGLKTVLNEKRTANRHVIVKKNVGNFRRFDIPRILSTLEIFTAF